MSSQVYGVDAILSSALDALALRQQVTAHNIANVNTPGFKRGTVPFERQLQKALGKRNPQLLPTMTHSRHLLPNSSRSALSVVIDRTSSLRNDGNNVDIEREAAQQAKDTLQYQAIISQVNRRLSALRSVIHDGRR